MPIWSVSKGLIALSRNGQSSRLDWAHWSRGLAAESLVAQLRAIAHELARDQFDPHFLAMRTSKRLAIREDCYTLVSFRALDPIDHDARSSSNTVPIVRDISQGGMSLLHPGALGIGTMCDAVFCNSQKVPLFGVEGQVVRCVQLHNTIHEVGVRFCVQAPVWLIAQPEEPSDVQEVNQRIARLAELAAQLLVSDHHPAPVSPTHAQLQSDHVSRPAIDQPSASNAPSTNAA
jgi:hypothetical protein